MGRHPRQGCGKTGALSLPMLRTWRILSSNSHHLYTMAGLTEHTANSLTLLNTLVHPQYFPFPWAPTLHAARISLVYQSSIQQSKTKSFWGPYIAGYLITCWAGGVATHLLLGLPPPMAFSFHPYINYLTVHLVLTAFFSAFPSVR